MIYLSYTSQQLYCARSDYPNIPRKGGRDGDAAFLIKPPTLRYNSNIKNILFAHSQEVTNLLIDAGLATDLNNIDLESTPPAKHRKSFGIIYALYEHGKLVKIGTTTDVAERKKGYREHYKKHYKEIDFDRDCKLIELVAFDGIPLDVEQNLTTVLCRFLDSIIANPTTPQGMRLFVVELRERGWHRGGLKKYWLIQLCEVGFQLHYKLPYQSVKGEVFMWDQSKFDHHVDKAKEVALQLVALAGDFDSIDPETSEYIPAPTKYEKFAISTWKTGSSNSISSFEAHIEHIVGKGNYENTIKKALHPNAEKRAQIFDDNFPISWYVDAYACFVTQLEYLYWNRKEDIIRYILVDVQDFMFGNLFEHQRVMTDIGFEYRGEELGGEIIVYRAGNVVLYLHGMPSLASDSRTSIKWSQKHIRSIALDAIKGGIELGTGEIEYVEDMTVCNILGAMYAENIVCGGHGSLRFASAVQRDLLMQTGVNAIDLFRGPITINNFYYPF